MGNEQRREHVRYDPDENALAIIHFGGEEDNSLVGLLRDESHEGCAAVYHKEYFPFDTNDEVTLKVDRLRPSQAEIVWKDELDEKLVKVGFHFVE